MILRKSKLTYLFWGLSVIFVLFNFYCLGIESGKIFSALPVDSSIAGFGFVAICIVLAEIISLCSKVIIKHQKDNRKELGAFIEGVLLFFVMVISFFSSFIFITDKIDVDSTFIVDINDSKPIDFLFIKLSDCLSFLDSNHVTRILYIDSFITLIVIFFIFITVRKLIGFIPAIISSVLFGALSYGITIESRSALLVSISMFLIVLPKWATVKNRFTTRINLVLLFLAGVISGFTILSDFSDIGILLFAVCVFFLYKDDSYSEFSNRGKVLIYAIGAVFGFIAGNKLLVYFGYGDYKSVINSITSHTEISEIGVHGHVPILAVALTLCMVWCIRLFKIERDHGSFIIIVPFVCYVLYALENSGATLSIGLVNLYLSIMASIGFVSIGKNSLEYIEKEKLAKEQAEREKAEKIAAMKKELEEKKAKLAEKEKDKMKLNKKDSVKNSIDISRVSTNDTDIKSLEESLEFLHKSSDTINDSTSDSISDKNIDNENNEADDINDGLEVKADFVDKISDAVSEDAMPGSNNFETIENNSDLMTDVSTETEDHTNENGDSLVLPTQYASEKPPLKVSPIKEDKPRYVSMSSPSSKFARRMDYRTAIVRPGNTELISEGASDTNEVKENPTKESIDELTSHVINEASTDSKQEEIEDNVVPDLMSVNIIETKEDIQDSDGNTNETANESDDSSDLNTEKVSDVSKEENVLDLKAMEKNEAQVEEPKPAPEPAPVSASEPVLKSVVAKKPPILGKDVEPVNKIHNPLPTPKKHVNRELEFDIEPAESDLHFDIVDLAGKDFFDIN